MSGLPSFIDWRPDMRASAIEWTSSKASDSSKCCKTSLSPLSTLATSVHWTLCSLRKALSFRTFRRMRLGCTRSEEFTSDLLYRGHIVFHVLHDYNILTLH